MIKLNGESARRRPVPRLFGEQNGRHHRVLGLRSCENDPVIIITAAQVRLRRWRRFPAPKTEVPPSGLVDQIRRIIIARDALLERAYGSLPAHGGGTPVGRG